MKVVRGTILLGCSLLNFHFQEEQSEVRFLEKHEYFLITMVGNFGNMKEKTLTSLDFADSKHKTPLAANNVQNRFKKKKSKKWQLNTSWFNDKGQQERKLEIGRKRLKTFLSFTVSFFWHINIFPFFLQHLLWFQFSGILF